MRIGITYDLRDDHLAAGRSEEDAAEFDDEATIVGIEAALDGLGHAPDRIGHIRALAKRLSDGERWDLVFNIAEGLEGFSREAQAPALLDAFGVAYTFSDPLTLSIALHKPTAKRVLRDQGLPTPNFAVVESAIEIDDLSLAFPLFVKPVAEGSSKGVSATSKVDDRATLRAECERLLHRFQQPVLVEAFLSGREFTVGVIGTGRYATALGVMEVLLATAAEPDAYTFENKKYYEARVRYRLATGELVAEASELAVAAWRALGCRDAGRVDLRCDAEGRLSVMEVNPLPGLNPAHSDLVILGRMLGISHSELIGRIVESALRRSLDRDDGQPGRRRVTG